ncbi:putative Glycoprotein-N-acetylgalactosamine 3-beta-galactosyltransferase 1 [Hypsibius exemplaris]|uniref:N-acetylgalactosaminide beta-1,3-galactosyltransferase n=1 Tax=Hypsibius exemplaris TaxID=2072580 RepID=A0A9X6NHU1_HYPEX|nr:putative Glycoprotein-N-acetylgalactosamine 3-beta-galactosyltransferase 1 [Hypsibius exemplaris]
MADVFTKYLTTKNLAHSDFQTFHSKITSEKDDDRDLYAAPQNQLDLLEFQNDSNVRIFCWILTSPATRNKTIAVHDTWAKRCDGYVFISSEEDAEFHVVNASLPEGRDYLWGKTKFALGHIYNNTLKDYDWFLKADDDTFVIMENLRRFLSNYSHADPLYFGCQFSPFTPQGYMSGGAGYVLSREAVRLFVEEGLAKGVCRTDDAGDALIRSWHVSL